MKSNSQFSLGSLAAAVLYTVSAPVGSGAIFAEDFNSFTAPAGNFNGGQFESGLAVAFSGDLPGWAKAGGGTVHAVDHANAFPSNPATADFATMIWQDNVITQNVAISGSNTASVPYLVSFEASPAVYQAPSQVTTVADGLLIEVLRGDDSVLASHTHLPGDWAGNINLVSDSFSYTGDGSGDIRFRIGPSNFNSGHFGGAIDNLSLDQIPEPTSVSLLGLGGLALMLRRSRRTK